MNNLIKEIPVKYGLIGFTLIIVAYFAMWQIDLGLFLNPLITYPISIIVFILGVVSQTQAKKQLEGYLSFGTALLYFIFTVAIALLGYVIAGLLIFNIIDPGAKEELVELSIEAAMEMSSTILSWFGMEDISGQVSEEQIRQQMKFSPTPFGYASLIIGYIGNIIMFTVGGLISSLIIKKEKPYEFE
ncbi:DUF4199 domain-containing protein [Nonlabens sp. Asnod2-A12]|uniref:DUF4199 domain-containing protein n=1 Tax=Nonlabens sp. Asnod2-A12 TaxID=3160578 RepID=UPI00386CBF8D